MDLTCLTLCADLIGSLPGGRGPDVSHPRVEHHVSVCDSKPSCQKD